MENKDYLEVKKEMEKLAYEELSKWSNHIQKHSKTKEKNEVKEMGGENGSCDNDPIKNNLK